MRLPADMQDMLEQAWQYTRERETEREIIEEVDPEWEWRPELLRWVRLEP